VRGVPTGGGVWAPTLRHHDGRFWLVVPDMMGTGRGNILFTAEDPAGPWSDGVVLDAFGIDPDIAWDDDGTCFVTMSGLGINEDGTMVHLGITQVIIDPDTGAALSEPKRLWSGIGGMFPEAPHLYRIGDWWYLMIAEGGTEHGHSVTIARGRSPEGPFEGAPHNPIVTARGSDRPVQNTGHGDLVQTPDGGWAMVLLGTRPRSSTRAFAPMGRETFVTPVSWDDEGWPHAEPVLLDARHEPIERKINFLSDTAAALDGFDGEIIAVRQYPRDVADLSARPGAARLAGRGVGMEDPQPVFLGIRQCTEEATVTVTLDVSTGAGGIAMRFDEHAHFDVEASIDAVTATMHAYGLSQTWKHARSEPDAEVRLRIVATPPTPGKIDLAASCDRLTAEELDDEWVEFAGVDGRFLSSEVCESFTGRVVGPYAREGIVDVLAWDYAGQDIQR
jgi:xylan 1,4-beta-xylosidase